MSDYLAAFTLGLLSLPHCFAMCGGISMALLSTGRSNAGNALLYGGGKLIAYVLLGTVAGLAGLLLGGLGTTWALLLRLFAGILLIAMGCYALGLWRGPSQLETQAMRFWQPMVKQLRRLDLKRPGHRLLAGVGWGMIPCGMVYSAMGLALASGSLGSGALVMASFGIGTLPFVFAMAGLASVLTPLIRHPYWKRLAGILLIALGAWTVQLALA